MQRGTEWWESRSGLNLEPTELNGWMFSKRKKERSRVTEDESLNNWKESITVC